MAAAWIYLAAVLLANLTATLFIPFPVFGQVAVGTLVFGVTFTQRDRMHAAGGRRLVYRFIALAAGLNLVQMIALAAGMGELLAHWSRAAGSDWLAGNFETLSTSGLRVFAASTLAIVLAEAADTEVYHHLRRRSWWVRVGGSNLVSVPLDSLIFNLVAFVGIFPPLLLAQIIFGEVVVKYLTGAVAALGKPRDESVARPPAEAVRTADRTTG